MQELEGKVLLIRYIHPGGEYVKGDGEYEELEEAIEREVKNGE